jgi:hypothetical protein
MRKELAEKKEKSAEAAEKKRQNKLAQLKKDLAKWDGFGIPDEQSGCPMLCSSGHAAHRCCRRQRLRTAAWLTGTALHLFRLGASTRSCGCVSKPPLGRLFREGANAGKFSEWDAEHLPTKLLSGEEVSKKARVNYQSVDV